MSEGNFACSNKGESLRGAGFVWFGLFFFKKVSRFFLEVGAHILAFEG